MAATFLTFMNVNSKTAKSPGLLCKQGVCKAPLNLIVFLQVARVACIISSQIIPLLIIM